MKKGLRWLDQNLEECLMVFLLAAMTVLLYEEVYLDQDRTICGIVSKEGESPL